MAAMQRAAKANDYVRHSLARELEAKYNADLAGRRHAAVDPAKRLVARKAREGELTTEGGGQIVAHRGTLRERG